MTNVSKRLAELAKKEGWSPTKLENEIEGIGERTLSRPLRQEKEWSLENITKVIEHLKLDQKSIFYVFTGELVPEIIHNDQYKEPDARNQKNAKQSFTEWMSNIEQRLDDAHNEIRNLKIQLREKR